LDPLEVNVSTLLVVLILGHVATGILLFSYTLRLYKSKAVNIFLLSKLVQTVAWITFALRSTNSSMSIMILGNALLLAGLAMELSAFLMMKGRFAKARKTIAALLAASVLVFVAVVALDTSQSTRIAVASLVCAVLMVYPVWMLFTDKGASFLQKVIAEFYSGVILILILRAINAFDGNLDMCLSSANPFNVAMFLMLYLVMLVGSTGFILLDKEKVDHETLRAASVDGFTDIANRETFFRRSREVLSLCERNGETVSCLMIDIDGFKKTNDEYGHHAGDKVLIDFAENMRRTLRSSDIFGRYGGDEFAVLLPQTDERQSMEVAERLRKAAENAVIVDEHQIRYTVSVGSATIVPDMETNIESIFKLSDNALYSAKTQGKNRIASALRFAD